jgi:hypothetical protein
MAIRSDSQVARRPPATVAMSSLQIGMITAVRADGSIGRRDRGRRQGVRVTAQQREVTHQRGHEAGRHPAQQQGEQAALQGTAQKPCSLPGATLSSSQVAPAGAAITRRQQQAAAVAGHPGPRRRGQRRARLHAEQRSEQQHQPVAQHRTGARPGARHHAAAAHRRRGLGQRAGRFVGGRVVHCGGSA